MPLKPSQIVVKGPLDGVGGPLRLLAGLRIQAGLISLLTKPPGPCGALGLVEADQGRAIRVSDVVRGPEPALRILAASQPSAGRSGASLVFGDASIAQVQANRPDRPQRVVSPHPLPPIDLGKQFSRPLVRPRIVPSIKSHYREGITETFRRPSGFSTTC